jgi:hypothetical protein
LSDKPVTPWFRPGLFGDNHYRGITWAPTRRNGQQAGDNMASSFDIEQGGINPHSVDLLRLARHRPRRVCARSAGHQVDA